jgi:hypothetical protein
VTIGKAKVIEKQNRVPEPVTPLSKGSDLVSVSSPKKKATGEASRKQATQSKIHVYRPASSGVFGAAGHSVVP